MLYIATDATFDSELIIIMFRKFLKTLNRLLH